MDILELLKKYGVEIAEDKASDFNSEFRKSFKSAAKGSENEEKLKKEVEDYKNQLADIKFNTLLEKGLTGIEFANDRVKQSVLAEIKGKGFEENEKGELAGLSDYLKDLYKKEPETFKAVDANVHTWGASKEEKENSGEKKYSGLFGTIL